MLEIASKSIPTQNATAPSRSSSPLLGSLPRPWILLYGEWVSVVQVVRDERIETRIVTIGLQSEGNVEIRQGIVDGEMVVARAGAFLPLFGNKLQRRCAGWGSVIGQENLR
jgi:hypothetical protein